MNVVLTHSSPLWGLPAHDARCLEVMLYLEMSGMSYQRRLCKYTFNPFAPELVLPILRYNTTTVCGDAIIDFFENANENASSIYAATNNAPTNSSPLDMSLSPTQRADVAALSALIRDRLHLVVVSCF